MRNLTVLNHRFVDLQSHVQGDVLYFVVDSERKNVFFITNKLLFCGVRLETGQLWLELAWGGESEDSLLAPETKISGMDYIPDLDSVCVTTRQGDIILYQPTRNQVDTVGVIDSGITCMAWSPDYEIVVFTTGNNSVLLMTKEWDIIVENPIPPREAKKGTANSQNQAETQNQINEDIWPSISWRGDGNFFVINSLDQNGESTLRAWDRSCNLNSTSEEVKGMSNKVSWKPSGSLIASSQSSSQKNDIIFFERNGLRHGEFGVRAKADVVDIRWNSDSDIIAIA